MKISVVEKSNKCLKTAVHSDSRSGSIDLEDSMRLLAHLVEKHDIDNKRKYNNWIDLYVEYIDLTNEPVGRVQLIKRWNANKARFAELIGSHDRGEDAVVDLLGLSDQESVNIKVEPSLPLLENLDEDGDQ